MMSSCEILITFAIGGAAGCAVVAIALAGWEHKPLHLSPEPVVDPAIRLQKAVVPGVARFEGKAGSRR